MICKPCFITFINFSVFSIVSVHRKSHDSNSWFEFHSRILLWQKFVNRKSIAEATANQKIPSLLPLNMPVAIKMCHIYPAEVHMYTGGLKESTGIISRLLYYSLVRFENCNPLTLWYWQKFGKSCHNHFFQVELLIVINIVISILITIQQKCYIKL